MNNNTTDNQGLSSSKFRTIFFIMAFEGYAQGINTVASPHIATEFHLDDAAVARLFGWIGFGALGTIVGSRLMDIFGRQRLLFVSYIAVAILAICSALAMNVESYIFAQIVLRAFGFTIGVACKVMITEELSDEERAKGQSWGGLAGIIGAGNAFILMAIFTNIAGTWRWVWGFAATAIVWFPIVKSKISGAGHFYKTKENEEIKSSSWRELFHKKYQRRTIIILTANFLQDISTGTMFAWVIYYPVKKLEIAPGIVSAMFVSGGAIAFLGFFLGYRFADRFGRKACCIIFGLCEMIAGISYYMMPTKSNPFLIPGLILCFLLLMICSNASNVSFRTWSTELFPTRLRATLQGAVIVVYSISQILAQFATAYLINIVGELVIAVVILMLAMIPSRITYFFLPETRGMALHESSLE